MEMLATVLSGVFVFIIGESILKLIIIPSLELKKSIGLVSHILLVNNGRITSKQYDIELSNKIKFSAADICPKSEVILDYVYVRNIFDLPMKKEIMNAAQSLNLLSYANNHKIEGESDSTDDVLEAFNQIEKNLKIKTMYRD